MSRRIKILLALLLLWISTYGTPAYADTQAIAGIMSPFDLTDSHGIRISQFALNIDMGNPVTSAWKLMLTPILISAWALYSWGIGFVAWALNFTIEMSWATYITSAFNMAANAIRNNILAPAGATSYGGGIIMLMMSIAAISITITLHRRGTGSAIAAALWSSLAAALAVGVLATPVATLAGGDQLGTPLQYARGFVIESMAAINGVDAPPDTSSTDLPDNLKPSTVLIDAFVRLPHQEYNYGEEIDGTKCEGAYDSALKAGPVDAASDQTRSKVGDCDGKYHDYADGADFWWLIVQAMFGMTGTAITSAVAVLLLLAWSAVMLLSWSALKTMVHALTAIVSPGAWGPLIKDLVDCAVSLIQVVTGPIVLTIGLVVIKRIFGAGGGSGDAAAQSATLAAKFLITDGALFGVVVLLIVNHRGHKQWGRKMWRKLAERSPAPTASRGKGLVLKGMVGAQAGRMAWQQYRSHAPQRIGGRAVSSVRGSVARTAVGVGVSKGLQVAAGAATGGQATMAIKTVGVASKVMQRYTPIRQGQAAGGIGGNALVSVARAHNAITTRKNLALNAVDERVDSARTLMTTGQATVGNRGVPVTTGSQKIDEVLTGVGRGRRRVRETVEASSDVIATARSTGRRGTAVSTGHERLDTALSTVGQVQKRGDQVQEFATKPRSATPPVARTRPVQVRRPATTAPARRGAPGVDHPAPVNPAGTRPAASTQPGSTQPGSQMPRPDGPRRPAGSGAQRAPRANQPVNPAPAPTHAPKDHPPRQTPPSTQAPAPAPSSGTTTATKPTVRKSAPRAPRPRTTSTVAKDPK